MSSPNQARRVTAQIFFQGVDITGSMRPYLLSATYTDREEDGTDDLQRKLQDRDDVWLKKQLEAQHVTRIGDVFLATVNAQNELAVYPRTGERVAHEMFE